MIEKLPENIRKSRERFAAEKKSGMYEIKMTG